jgi:hypothetical protein
MDSLKHLDLRVNGQWLVYQVKETQSEWSLNELARMAGFCCRKQQFLNNANCWYNKHISEVCEKGEVAEWERVDFRYPKKDSASGYVGISE